MIDEKLPQSIRQVLDQGVHDLDADTVRRLRQARYRALQQLPERRFAWRLPALGAAMAGLIAALLIVPAPQDQEVELDMAVFTPEDLEMLSSLDVEELEPLDFYYWLGSRNGSA